MNEKLVLLRSKAGFSQFKLAELLEVHQTTVSNWENGYRQPSKENKLKLAKLYGVSVEYLFYESYYDTVS
ncbi:helix-turn-helix transcriptional regulator [Bacillus pumilus]|uniref:helix-turn-helix transcriptional regulator n=1 Tax=Bacillus pumilus TaxID=1408 RepID=UPI0025A2B371|nr:helix-turn-helix transcriptional regulator [Bacillus pumilus]MDM5320388.1 helix-turn-helix transcriptional regulator [Bacillus pumilus]